MTIKVFIKPRKHLLCVPPLNSVIVGRLTVLLRHWKLYHTSALRQSRLQYLGVFPPQSPATEIKQFYLYESPGRFTLPTALNCWPYHVLISPDHATSIGQDFITSSTIDCNTTSVHVSYYPSLGQESSWEE